jgi:NAD(P)-dependent dehydrogenase (short-subunit alcohol dehydrogenase family)
VPRFEGRTFLVTGASSGIGLASARVLAAGGARLVCTARDQLKLEQAVSQLPGEGHLSLPFDAANENEVAAAGKTLRAAGRQLNGAVLCAGRHALRPLALSNAATFHESFASNTVSALLCTRMAVGLAPKIGASFVWLSSAAALIGNSGESAYAASKAALLAACRSVATELASRKIRVNAVAAGVVETPMSEKWLNLLSPAQLEAIRTRHLLGFGTPEDVAAAIAFLISDDARWITGTCLTIDGGLTCH